MSVKGTLELGITINLLMLPSQLHGTALQLCRSEDQLLDTRVSVLPVNKSCYSEGKKWKLAKPELAQ